MEKLRSEVQQFIKKKKIFVGVGLVQFIVLIWAISSVDSSSRVIISIALSLSVIAFIIVMGESSRSDLEVYDSLKEEIDRLKAELEELRDEPKIKS